ncbi:CHASE3 domain-containing protein [Parasalinivibrio latis]|uniref:CHASE3 domain-containing protein n=1 Tax=Parasalinivibrio latis TaxID=2952610 RepID=UPI0030E3D7AA
MFEGVSLRAKIMWGNGISLLFLLILGVFSLLSIQELKSTEEWVDHTHRVILKAKEVEAAAVDMETGKRGYLLAGKEQFLEPYISGRQRFDALIDELKTVVSNDPPQVVLLGEMEETISEWQSEVTEYAISLRREIGDAKNMNDMAKLIGETKGKQYFDEFRSLISMFVSREQDLLNERQLVFSQTFEPAELRDAVSWVTHTHEVIEQALMIETAALDMETGMRGYLLAGEETFLEPYNNGSQQFFILVNALKNRVSDNPAQVELLQDIESVISEWQEQVVVSQIQLRRDIGHAKTMDDVSDFVAQAKGKKFFDKFREQIRTFNEREEALMAERIKAAETTVNVAYISLIGGILLAVLLSVISALILSRSVTKPFREIFKGLDSFSTRELNNMSGAFMSIVQRMGQGSAHLATVSNNIDEASQNLFNISNQQAASVEQTSASSEQIASMVNANAQAAEESRNVSMTVSEQMEELDEAMSKISDSNQKIADLVKIIEEIGTKTEVIDEIVFQTKLLSFNASVEAKRAGDHGRGFTVVAQEVGNLAEKSGRAAMDIAAIVKQSTSEAEAIVRENCQRVENGASIVSTTKKQTKIVTEEAKKIFNASNEQSRGIEELSSAIESINLTTQHASTIAEQASISSNDLRTQADDLNRMVMNLNSFLRGEENEPADSVLESSQQELPSNGVVVSLVRPDGQGGSVNDGNNENYSAKRHS